MEVTFERTGDRRYGVFVERAEFPSLEMDPAPSYDADLPHDVVHFVVEEELGLTGGVFGQLAEGGDAGTFRLVEGDASPREMARARRRQQRTGRRRSREGADQAEFSERAATICHHEWFVRFPTPRRVAEVSRLETFVQKVRRDCSPAERALLSEAVVARICSRLEELSRRWSNVGVGDSIRLRWSPGVGGKGSR